MPPLDIPFRIHPSLVNPPVVGQPLLLVPFRKPADFFPIGFHPKAKIGMMRQSVTELVSKAIPGRILPSHIVITRVVGGDRDVSSEIVDGGPLRRLLEPAQS